MTRAEIDKEIAEKTVDVEEFYRAYQLIHARIRDSQDRNCTILPLHEWSGATGLVDMMEVILHNMEHLVEDLQKTRAKMVEAEAFDGPALRVVKGQSDDQA